MKLLLSIILALLITDPKEISKVNSLKKEAESAYQSQDYELAMAKYTLLRDSLGVDDPAVNLNLAHTHFHLGDTAGARSNYNQLTSSKNLKLKSIAFQQLGIISKDKGKLKEALNQFKSSLKADPRNNESRYNYEVVKKLLQNKDSQNNEDENQDGDGDNEKDIKPSEFAKAMKKKSDELRYQGNFQRAYDTMVEAYAVDKTVEAYDEYIKKLQKVLLGEE